MLHAAYSNILALWFHTIKLKLFSFLSQTRINESRGGAIFYLFFAHCLIIINIFAQYYLYFLISSVKKDTVLTQNFEIHKFDVERRKLKPILCRVSFWKETGWTRHCWQTDEQVMLYIMQQFIFVAYKKWISQSNKE
jgi:hypothetical protein